MDPLTHLRVSIDAQRLAAARLHELAHEVAGGRWLALGGGGYAMVDVVPRSWTHVLAIAAHAPVDVGVEVPGAWREMVSERYGRSGADRMGDGREPVLRPWSAGYDPADEVDRAIRATRLASFPHLGLDPDHD
jgi:acetoin utilization protein AcuC